MTDKLLYQIGLTMINGVGGILARQLLHAFGDAEAVFREKRQTLERVPGIGALLAAEVKRPEVLQRAEKELQFIEKAQLVTYYIEDADYPYRLKECPDAPIILYYKGVADLNAKRILSVVGTRHITSYGQEMSARLLDELAEVFPDVLIVSGLAYGVDISAHRNALRNHLPTVGVLAHGLDRIYPPAHRQTAVEMLAEGGLLTNFSSNSFPDRTFFLSRNRIIAGLSDATIVVESASKGGSLVTAGVALSYGREVYAFPGRSNDLYSMGCNNLIRTDKARLITNASDLIDMLEWQKPAFSPQQVEIQFDDSPETQQVVSLLQSQKELHINQITKATGIPVAQLTSLLFELEMDGRIKTLPGNRYVLLR